jgi:hypothetical protein
MGHLLFQKSPGAELKFELIFPFVYLIAALEPNEYYHYSSLIHKELLLLTLIPTISAMMSWCPTKGNQFVYHCPKSQMFLEISHVAHF